MTAPTLEQMRALAERLDAQSKALGDYWDFMTANERRLLQDSAAALRAAADQLEAVRRVVVDNSFQAFDGEVVVYSDLVTEIVFPADTAPQEDRDD